MADEELLLEHIRSASALGSQAASAGRHEDGWKIFRDSANSVIAAAPGNAHNKKLQVVLKVAEQESDMHKRASMMQQAFSKLLLGRSPTGAPHRGPPSRPGSQPGTDSGTLQNSAEPFHKLGRPATEHRMRASRARGLGLGLQAADKVLKEQEVRLDSPSFTDPRKGPVHLQQYLQEVSRHPPGGRAPIYRSSSAPYFEATPHATDHYFSGSEKDGRVTSHYTKKGAPRSNSHYKNTLAGANTSFDDYDPWKTSNQVFQGSAEKYDVKPPERFKKDANFQYVNGDPAQGVAANWQRVMLPAYHRTQAEINGIGMGGR
eukprot:TRINITY_DN62056_c0_g1_i1.p1 TRINITY_DN62056_c0_g1~~TRINITY_DN62056_c0_g1_i1.p1  ORF type:complete len:328 (-),score=65.21 TRINITY_DN62056_c0_g1_i1:356-1306(-)